MQSLKPKRRVLAAVAILLSAAFAVSCKGFFVNSPDSLAISPTSVTFANVGDTQQLSAQATFGSRTQDVTNSTVWKTSNVCAVSVSTTTLGQFTALGTGASVTLTATYNGVSATVTATVPTGIAITPCGNNGTFSSGGSTDFVATFSGSDVTSTATWSSSDTTIVSFPSTSSSHANFGPTTGTATITATTGSSKGELQVTVK